MSITNPTVFSQLAIGAADRAADALRVETWRTVNSVGVWKAALRNIDGAYNNTFDVQDQFLVDINGLANTIMQGRVDGPAVFLQGADAESTWDEYVIVGGYDQGQDLLFHNDFDESYPVTTQQIKAVLNDIFNVQLVADTNITYAPPAGATPVVGGIGFSMGTSFLSTLQDLYQRALNGWLFYVDDTLALQSGAPGFSNSGVTITCDSENPLNNVIGTVNFQRRDGGKLYNKISVYGKTPQFDAYTEQTSSRWGTVNAGWTLSDDQVVKAAVIGNDASIKMTKAVPAAVFQGFTLDFSQMGQDEVDMSSGEIGFWWRYDGGTSINRACARVSLLDNLANQIYFFSGNSIPGGGVASQVNSTRCIQGEWGWCTAPVGRDNDPAAPFIPDSWVNYPVGGFNWDRVTDMSIGYQTTGVDTPTEMHIDGLMLPFPALGFAEDSGVGSSQATYRVRPLIVNAPYLRHQVTLEDKATQLLSHHKDSGIDAIEFATAGDSGLRYAGQTITVTVPDLGLNDALFYMTYIHHIIEPYVDVSTGYGFDWVTEVKAIPINGAVYDMGRLRGGSLYSPAQLAARAGTGLSVK